MEKMTVKEGNDMLRFVAEHFEDMANHEPDEEVRTLYKKAAVAARNSIELWNKATEVYQRHQELQG